MATHQKVLPYRVTKTRSSSKLRLQKQVETPSLPSLSSPIKRPRETALKPKCSPPKIRKDKTVEENSADFLSTPKNSQTFSPLRTISSPQKKIENNCIERGDVTPVKKSNFDWKVDENSPAKTKVGHSEISPVKTFTPLRLFSQDLTVYQQAKQALHTAATTRLVGREKEIKQISAFITEHIKNKKPGSLYISGAPGTGKTATMYNTLNGFKFSKSDVKVVSINCMSLKNSEDIFTKIAEEMKVKPKGKRSLSSSLQNCFTKAGPMILLVLDEVDYLASKSQQVLYTLFEWPLLANSRLVLIGVANCLDLTERILPRLAGFPTKPDQIHYQPYSREQIAAIIKDRLEQAGSEISQVVKPGAVMLCARKLGTSGDVRKALDVCRRAVEQVEVNTRKQKILKPVTDGENPCKSPKKLSANCVEATHIAAIINDIYGPQVTRGTMGNVSSDALPLQQRILVCCLLRLLKQGKGKEILLGKLRDTYCQVCKKLGVTEVDESELTGMCSLVESRGIIAVKKHKEARLSMVTLRLEEQEVELCLQDKTLLSSIMDESMIVKK